ncbi:MAG: DNA-directed RNA polymerase subunit alpha [Fimbriimonadaceae bacterium]|nr:DNA-directed RNA polymerase subunit alpha [Fimbriimonadaceae bacterium]
MPQIQTLELTETYGKIVLEPLERGYGNTLGNALRRVLYSSIQGWSVTAIRIERVFNEFQAIPGLKEDATEFILNLKELAVRVSPDLAAEDEIILKLEVKGSGRVTGADIVCPEGVEVVNPDCYLATINSANDVLNAELYLGSGTGYVLPDRHEQYRGVIGLIPVGTQYTPVKKVNYIVEQTRVGNRTDYERLVLEVWTNGSVPPNDAVTQAAHILDKFFRMFFDLGEAGYEPEIELPEVEATELSHIPEIKIEELDFSQRTFNCLRRASLLTLRQLATVSEADLIGIRGFGKKSLGEVKDKLAEHGIDLKLSRGGFIPSDYDDEEDED